MTYNVFSGTLNPSQSMQLTHKLPCMLAIKQSHLVLSAAENTAGTFTISINTLQVKPVAMRFFFLCQFQRALPWA